MLAKLLLPGLDVLQLDTITATADTITIEMTAMQPEASCPLCEHRSRSVHSHYTRTVADLAWATIPVRLHLHVRKFFCRNADCTRTIFTERLPTVVASWARRSVRLAEHQRALALDLGGEASARAGVRLGLPASSATVLRLVRRRPLASRPTPRVLGVDDWARRKGQTYGTILIDLETHAPVDLLPDRSAETLAQWLQDHPGVEIISRDRSSTYADGIIRGAPQATQVADRFHLVGNLRDALEGVVARYYSDVALCQAPPPAALALTETILDQVEPSASVVALPEGSTAAGSQLVGLRRPKDEERRATNRARRLARYEEVVALHQQGLSQKTIAARLGLSAKTISRWLRAGTFPERAPRPKRATRLDPYVPYLQERWASGCHNARQLWRELCAQGYPGSRTLVVEWATRQRRLDRSAMTRPHTEVPAVAPAPPSVITERVRSARQATWLFVRDREALSPDDQQFLERLLAANARLALAYQLAQDFRRLLKERQAEGFDHWLEAVAAADLPELQRFATGLNRDRESVLAALRLPYSNGPVEGHITRLKFIKRQGYGRAGFDLLKRRVLAA